MTIHFATDLSDEASRQRADHEVLVGIAGLLEEVLAELKRANSIERTGAVSSIQIEDNPTKDRPVRISTKHYVGSPLTPETIDEQMQAHAYAHREAERLAMQQWEDSVAVLRNGGKSA